MDNANLNATECQHGHQDMQHKSFTTRQKCNHHYALVKMTIYTYKIGDVTHLYIKWQAWL